MKKSRSVAGIAVGVSAVVLVIAGAIAYRASGELARNSRDVVNAKELELSLERLLSTLRDAETGQRGYLLTGGDAYLAPYEEALDQLDERLATVEARARDGDIPPEEVRHVHELVGRKIGELSRTVALVRAGRTDAAQAVLRSGEGKSLMDSLRALVGARADAERAHVARLVDVEGEALRATIRANLLVSGLAIALMLVLGWVVRRDTARLRDSEERLATTLRSIGDAVIATDEHGAVTLANPVAERLTGWPLDIARGRHLHEVFRIVNEQTRVPVESPVTKVLREGGVVGLANHTVLIHRAGSETPIEDSGAPIVDSTGAITGVVLVFRDATHERAASEALRAADRRKDEFLATLAHELRNPLAPIRQAAAMAARPDASPEQLRWSHAVIERQAAHMARLLDDLLDVSRITRGRLEVRRARVTLREVVDAAVETARPAIEAQQHELHVELPEERLALDADKLRLAQVLGNLLTNAAKYTPPRGVIRLIAERVGDQAVIRVRDNGIGLEPGDLPRIFEMFAQVQPTLDRNESGLGIGLALSRALMELHGGTLDARSDGPGKGSEFIARLALAAPADAVPEEVAPMKVVPEGVVLEDAVSENAVSENAVSEDAVPANAPPATGAAPADPPALAAADGSPAAVPAPTPQRVRVFLADDNRDACDSLEMFLTLEQHEVRTAYDGQSAFEGIAKFRPQIALLDIGMPGMNGYELAAKIREQPWGAGIHLVALTGWGQEGDRRRALEAGFDAHRVKPVDVVEISELCRSMASR